MIDYTTTFYLVLGFSIFSAALGFYIGERSLRGVEIDLANIKQDIINIKNKL